MFLLTLQKGQRLLELFLQSDSTPIGVFLLERALDEARGTCVTLSPLQGREDA